MTDSIPSDSNVMEKEHKKLENYDVLKLREGVEGEDNNAPHGKIPHTLIYTSLSWEQKACHMEVNVVNLCILILYNITLLRKDMNVL